MKRLAVVKAQHNIERFDIIQGLKCGSFNTEGMMGNIAHVRIIIPLLQGHDISFGVGYCFIIFGKALPQPQVR